MTKGSGEIKDVFISEGSEVKEGDVLFTTNGLETDLQLEQINAQINSYSRRIELLSIVEENATNGTNYFDRYNEEESEFYNKLNAAYIARKEFYVDKESLKKQGYDDKQIEEYAKTQKNKSDEHYYKTISEFTNEKNQYELELSKLVAQKEALEKGKGQYEVVAQKGGIVHLNTPLTSGMVLQGGSLIGTITSKEEELIVETMLPSSDRPRIHFGDALISFNATSAGIIGGTASALASYAASRVVSTTLKFLLGSTGWGFIIVTAAYALNVLYVTF